MYTGAAVDGLAYTGLGGAMETGAGAGGAGMYTELELPC